MTAAGDEKAKADTEKTSQKKPYEKACITEHDPLEESVATTYYYYTYVF